MSMSYKDIIILLNAGYTKEDISGMDAAEPDPTDIPQPEPQPDPQPAPAAPQPEPQPAPQPAPAAPQPEPQPAPQPAPQPDLLAAIRELTAAVQANNRAAADMGANIIDPIKAGQHAMAGIGGLKI